MLVALSDTHGRESTRLEGRTAEAVDAADLVIHAGDFMTEPVLDAFEDRCDLRGVYGNNADEAVRDRLPAERVVDWQDLRIAVTHGDGKTETALSMFARQSSADLLVFGHSHEPELRPGTVPMLNPGSHADPRWNRPAHAELTWDEEGGFARGRLVEPSGEVFEEFTVEPRSVEE
jgi:putative phosphoesterase